MTPEQERTLALAAARLRLKKIKQDAPEFRPSFQAPQPGFLEQVGRGVADVTQGVEQIGRRIFGDDAATAKWEAQKNAELQMYEQGQGDGFDVPRVIGNVIGTGPLALIPGGASAGVVARAATGAALGALGSGANYVDTSDGNFQGQKLAQTALGGVAGGLASAILPPAMKGVGRIISKAKNLAARLNLSSSDDVIVEISRRAAESGVDLSQVPEDMRRVILSQAMDQLDNTGQLDFPSLARRARLEQYGFTGDTGGTIGQITANPTQWRDEFALKQMSGVGEPLTDRFRAQGQRLHQVANELADNISPIDPNRGAQQISLDARDVAQEAFDASQRRVSAAYRLGRRAQGVGDLVTDAEGMRSRLTEVYDMFNDDIPAFLKSRIEGLVDGTKAATVENLDEALRMINSRQRMGAFSNPAQQAAAARTREILTRQLDLTARNGGEAAEGLRRAARLAAHRFGFTRGDMNTPSKIMEALNDGARADNLVEKVMSGNVDDLQHLRRFFTEFDEEAFPKIPKEQMVNTWNSLRAEVLRKINDAGRLGAGNRPEYANVSPEGMRLAWKKLGDVRQRVFFSDAEREAVDGLIEAAEILIKEPAHTVANRSGTGGMVYNLFRRLVSGVQHVPALKQFGNAMLGMVSQGEDFAIKLSSQQRVATSLTGRTYTEAQRRAAESRAIALLERFGAAGPATAGSAGAVAADAYLNSPAQPLNEYPEQN